MNYVVDSKPKTWEHKYLGLSVHDAQLSLSFCHTTLETKYTGVQLVLCVPISCLLGIPKDGVASSTSRAISGEDLVHHHSAEHSNQTADNDSRQAPSFRRKKGGIAINQALLTHTKNISTERTYIFNEASIHQSIVSSPHHQSYTRTTDQMHSLLPFLLIRCPDDTPAKKENIF